LDNQNLSPFSVSQINASDFLLKYTAHLLRYCAQINPQRIKDTPAVNLCLRLVSTPSLCKGNRWKYTTHLRCRFTKNSPRRTKSTPAGVFCALLASASSICKRLTESLFVEAAILLFCGICSICLLCLPSCMGKLLLGEINCIVKPVERRCIFKSITLPMWKCKSDFTRLTPNCFLKQYKADRSAGKN